MAEVVRWWNDELLNRFPKGTPSVFDFLLLFADIAPTSPSASKTGCMCSYGNDPQDTHEPELLEFVELKENLSSAWLVRPDIPVESAQHEMASGRQGAARGEQHERVSVVPPHLEQAESPATRTDMSELQRRIETALLAGRLLEANRDLQVLQSCTDAERILGEAVIERITRVCSCRDRHQQMLEHLGECGWLTETLMENNTVCSCKLVEGQFAVRTSFELDGDIVRALAALLEFDVQCGFDRIVPSTAVADVILPLAGADNPMDSTWSVLSHEENLASSEDNVWQISAIDSLDEDNSLWVCMYTPPPSTAELREVLQRQIQPGRTRVKSGMGVYRLTPLTERRFRLDMIMESAMTPVAYKLMSSVPQSILKRILRAQAMQFPGALKKGMYRPELEARMDEGTRPELYGKIRHHIN
uniref:START domain-containing protein n=1 Tax=Noctiluca scintillans TaxID=2966 RepID=A0A7S0ZX99_NOCSC